jgi:hypothetical protein
MGLPRLPKTIVDGLDSGPLVNVCLASLKSVPYAYYAENRLVGHFDNALSCRMRYLDVAVMATASLVHNVVFGVIFSVVSCVTLGRVQVVLDQMRRHWTHAALAGVSATIAVMGTASPEMGIRANIAVLAAAGLAIVQLAQGEAIGKVTTAYQRNAQGFKDAILAGLGGDRAYFNQHFMPLFNHLDQNFGSSVHSLADLVQVAQRAISLFPFVIPSASSAVIRENLEGVVAEWSGAATV